MQKYSTLKLPDRSSILHSTQLSLNANLFAFLEIPLCEITEKKKKKDSPQARYPSIPQAIGLSPQLVCFINRL